MTVKCTGAEFLGFFQDKIFWNSSDRVKANDENTYWEDAQIFVNGNHADELDFDFENEIKPADVVEVRGGVVFGKVVGPKNPTVEAYLKRWLKAQTTCFVLVECPKDKLDELTKLVNSIGCKIVN